MRRRRRSNRDQRQVIWRIREAAESEVQNIGYWLLQPRDNLSLLLRLPFPRLRHGGGI